MRAHLLAIEQRIFVLHAHERRPAILLRNRVHFRELPGPHRACANVPNLSTLDKIMKRFHCLCNGRVRIEAVDLQEVDVCRLEPGERSLDLVEDRRTRQTRLIDIVPRISKLRVVESSDSNVIECEEVALCEDNDAIPWDVILLQEVADDALRFAIGIRVRCVNGRYPTVPSSL